MKDLFDLVPQFDPQWPLFTRRHRLVFERRFRLFEEYLERPATIDDLNEEQLDRFAAWLRRQTHRESRGYAPLTISRALDAVRRLWTFAYEASLRADSPGERIPPPGTIEVFRASPKRRRRPAQGDQLPYPSPTDPAAQRRDLATFFERIYWPRKIGGSPKTRRLYVITLRHLARWLGRRPTLDDLADDGVLHGYLQHRLATVAAPTAAKCRCNLMALGNFAFKKKHIDVCPDVQRIVAPDVAPDAWNLDQLRRLFDACRSETRTIEGLPGGDWWYALHLFAIDTGERTSATLALRWEWIDRNAGWVAIPGVVRKGGRKSMRYKLRGETLAAINHLWRQNRERVFLQTDNWRSAFYSRYNQILKRAGLPTGRRFKLQRMRRTFASLVEKAGGDATRALAHSSRRITEQSYLDETLIGRRPIVEFVELAIGGALASVVACCDDDDDSLPIAEVTHA